MPRRKAFTSRVKTPHPASLTWPRGSLFWLERSQQWAWRGYVVREGVVVRDQIALGVRGKEAIGWAKAEQIVCNGAEPPTPAKKERPETFEEAARRIVAVQAAQGIKEAMPTGKLKGDDTCVEDTSPRMRRLRRWAFPHIGRMWVTLIESDQIDEILANAVKAGKAKSTVDHIRDDLSTIFRSLHKSKRVGDNPVALVSVPANAKEDKRKRIVLTDHEFSRFMACPEVDEELHTLALVSRALGGMRTSDLHAWDWSFIDTESWSQGLVARPKTGTIDEHVIPEVVVPILRAWWDLSGRPRSGPVFPARKGLRVGEQKKRGTSYADRLRKALWAAGITRPMPGFDELQARIERQVERAIGKVQRAAIRRAGDKELRKLCYIQTASARFKPVDFHSFRRAYVTAVQKATQDLAASMRLAGHTDTKTHLGYRAHDEVLRLPDGALPNLAGIRQNAVHTIETLGAAVAVSKRSQNAPPPVAAEPLNPRKTMIAPSMTSEATAPEAVALSSLSYGRGPFFSRTYKSESRAKNRAQPFVTAEAVFSGVFASPAACEAVLRLVLRAMATGIAVGLVGGAS